MCCRLTIRASQGAAERLQLSADALDRVLAETFGLPVEPGWRPLLKRAVAAGQLD